MTRSPQFRLLSLQLLLSYLGAMAAILSISTAAMYQVVAHSVYRQLDEQLTVLANAAHTLPTTPIGRVRAGNRQPLDDDDGDLDLPQRRYVLRTDKSTALPSHRESRSNQPASNSANSASNPARAQQTLDNDGDLDLPWQQLRKADQGIEWFDAQERLLAEVGRSFPDHPLKLSFQTWEADDVRTLTVPIYAQNAQHALQGYIRVSEPIDDEVEQLEELLAGMAWGGVVAVILVGASGWWLTRRSLQPIEQAFQQLQQFTADASHELRSPLTAIKTATEVMQSHPERIHPADAKKIEMIASASRQMSRLVEDLLLLGRAQAVPDLVKRLIPLDELLEDLVTALQPIAQQQAIALTLAPLPELPVQGDPDQLRRLFTNLLENALQYTPAGGSVRVAIASKTHEQRVFIQIIDTGIGIAPEHLPLVFDRLWRADPARSRRAGGSGLGLAIAQTIAQTHGGSITVGSRLGSGSCFQVELPVG